MPPPGLGSPPRRSYLALGANLGCAAAVLREALDRVAAGSRLVAVSGFYLSRAWGVTDQPDFVNAVAAIEDDRAPQDLLGWLHDLEAAADRRRVRHWGPRTLDLDLLTWGADAYEGWRLTVPHPGLMGRAFVLAPLLELDPGFRHPVSGACGRRALAALPAADRRDLRRLARGYEGALARR